MEVQDGLSKHDKTVRPSKHGKIGQNRRGASKCPPRGLVRRVRGLWFRAVTTWKSGLGVCSRFPSKRQHPAWLRMIWIGVKWKIKVCIDRNGLMTNDHPLKWSNFWPWHMWWCLVRHMFVWISQDLRSTGQPCCFFKRLLERNKGSLLGNLDHYANVIGKNNNRLETTTPYDIHNIHNTNKQSCSFLKVKSRSFSNHQKKKLGGDVWCNWGRVIPTTHPISAWRLAWLAQKIWPATNFKSLQNFVRKKTTTCELLNCAGSVRRNMCILQGAGPQRAREPTKGWWIHWLTKATCQTIPNLKDPAMPLFR